MMHVGVVRWSSLLLMGAIACDDPVTAEPAGFPAAALAEADGALVHVEIRTSPEQPPVRGHCGVALLVTDRATMAPMSGLSLTVEPWMDSMGHGIHGAPAVVEVGDGIYVIEALLLSMPGRWTLRTDIAMPDGGDDYVELGIRVR